VEAQSLGTERWLRCTCQKGTGLFANRSWHRRACAWPRPEQLSESL